MFVQKLFKRDAEGATQSAVLDLRVVPKKTSWLPFQLTLHRLLVGWYHMLMVMFQEIWQSKSILHDNKNKTDHNNSSGGWSIWSQQLSKENQKSEGVLKFYDTSSHLYISIYRFTYIHLYQIKCTYDCVCMYAQESIISLQQSYFFLVLSGVHFSKLSSPFMSDPSDSQKSRCQMHQTHAFAAPYRHSPPWKWSPWTTTTQPKGWCKWWYKNSGAKQGSTPQLSYNPRQLPGITLLKAILQANIKSFPWELTLD